MLHLKPGDKMDVETGRDFTEEKTKTQLSDFEAEIRREAPLETSWDARQPRANEVPLATTAANPMSFDSWAAQPAPRRYAKSFGTGRSDTVDLGALKIFLILAGLTAGMALGLRLLF
jgi:hypothetical protein